MCQLPTDIWSRFRKYASPDFAVYGDKISQATKQTWYWISTKTWLVSLDKKWIVRHFNLQKLYPCSLLQDVSDSDVLWPIKCLCINFLHYVSHWRNFFKSPKVRQKSYLSFWTSLPWRRMLFFSKLIFKTDIWQFQELKWKNRSTIWHIYRVSLRIVHIFQPQSDIKNEFVLKWRGSFMTV